MPGDDIGTLHADYFVDLRHIEVCADSHPYDTKVGLEDRQLISDSDWLFRAGDIIGQSVCLPVAAGHVAFAVKQDGGEVGVIAIVFCHGEGQVTLSLTCEIRKTAQITSCTIGVKA